MDKEGDGGVLARRQLFSWIADVGRAQESMEEQHRTDWPKVLEELVNRCHLVHEEILATDRAGVLLDGKPE